MQALQELFLGQALALAGQLQQFDGLLTQPELAITELPVAEVGFALGVAPAGPFAQQVVEQLFAVALLVAGQAEYQQATEGDEQQALPGLQALPLGCIQAQRGQQLVAEKNPQSAEGQVASGQQQGAGRCRFHPDPYARGHGRWPECRV